MPYRLVIFDMDGTLTEELLDFAAIRRDIGLPDHLGILEGIAALPPADQPRGHAILDRHEMAAADTCALHPGAPQLLHTLAEKKIHTALLTRNSAPCAARILARHSLRLDHIATRENTPHKPHPDSLLNILRAFDIPPRQALMVGDSRYDLQAAHAAGTDSALLSIIPRPDEETCAHLATYRIRHLRDLLPLVAS